MRHQLRRPLAVAAAVSLTLGVISATTAANADDHSATAAEAAAVRAHESVMDYWSVDKVLDAKPREVVIDDQGRVSIDTTTKSIRDISAQGNAHWTRGGKVLQTTGKILFELPKNETEWAHYVCSASAINDGTSGKTVVLTASHCVYDQKYKQYARKWVFVPDYDSNHPDKMDKGLNFCAQTTHGCWTTSSLIATEEYRTGSGLDAQAFDYAFVVMGKGGKTWQQLDDVVGGQEIAFTPRNGDGYAFGYPAGKPYNGKELTYSDGHIGGGGMGIYNIKSQMTGGCSGGPWFIDFNERSGTGTLHSVNSFSFKSEEGPDRKMYGPALDSTARQYYNQALRTTPRPGVDVPGPIETPTKSPTPTFTPSNTPSSSPSGSIDPITPPPTSNPPVGGDTFSNTTRYSIEDYRTASSRITSTKANGQNVTISIDINHPCLEQLELTVVTPDGARNVVKRASYGYYCTPWRGSKSETYQMRSKTDGSWTLEVRDVRYGSTGTLNGWEIKFS